MTEIHDACVASGHSQLLIIRDIPVMLGLHEYFGLAEMSQPALQRVKTAWVNPYPALQPDLEFFCLASNNRGANYRVFSDLWRAEKWLKKRTTTSPSIPSYSFFLSQATA